MNNFQLATHYSAWWMLLFTILAFCYAWFLYQKIGPWGRTVNYFLASLRFLIVILIGLLFVDLKLIRIVNKVIQPTLVLAIDHSLSVQKGKADDWAQLMEKVPNFEKSLEKEGYNVQITTFDESHHSFPDSLELDYPQSNLDKLLRKAEADFKNEHLVAQVLFSDGIYNAGVSPNYFAYKSPIHTVGLGDTATRKDIGIKNISYNKVSYKGNKFPLIAELLNNGFDKAKATAQLWVDGKLKDQQEVNFSADPQLQTVNFLVEAEKAGVMSVEIRLLVPSEDQISQNNNRKIYPEIIEGKQKVALLAPSPHPDIKAIRAAIESSNSYEMEVFISSIKPVKKSKYDLVILFHLPDAAGVYQKEIKEFVDEGTPLWFIYGNSVNLRTFNQFNNIASVIPRRGNSDVVKPLVNSEFKLFSLTDYALKMINTMTPVNVPYGSYELAPQTDVLLFQSLAGINTERPLLMFSSGGNRKTGLMLAENFWQWRLQEFAVEERQDAFNELILKSVQYLAAREDKRRFKAYPTDSEYHNKKPVIFDTELYNDIFEQVYGNEVKLAITNQEGEVQNFSYTPLKGATTFEIGSLASGVYLYTAKTNFGQNNYELSGEFAVNDFNIEELQLTADFDLLRALSTKNKGQFVTINELDKLTKHLIENPYPAKIKSERKQSNLSELIWLYLLIFFLASVEWFLRKYLGSY